MNYWSMIQQEKQWSWSVMAILFLCAALLLRHLFLRNISFRMKRMPPESAKAVRTYYEKRSLIGWILFISCVALATWLWANPVLLENYLPALVWRMIAATLFVASLFYHVQAYAEALMDFMDERLSSERE